MVRLKEENRLSAWAPLSGLPALLLCTHLKACMQAPLGLC